MKRRSSQLLLHAASLLTDFPPGPGARLLNAMLLGMLGNRRGGASLRRLHEQLPAG